MPRKLRLGSRSECHFGLFQIHAVLNEVPAGSFKLFQHIVVNFQFAQVLLKLAGRGDPKGL